MLLLFVAGQDTTSSALAVASHFLAKHQDLQEKLYQEIKDAVDDNDDNPNLGKHILSCSQGIISSAKRSHLEFIAPVFHL